MLGFLFFQYILIVERDGERGKQWTKRLTLFFSFSRFSISISDSSYLLVSLLISLLLYISFSSSFFGPGKSSQYKTISRTVITKKCLIVTLLVIAIFSVNTNTCWKSVIKSYITAFIDFHRPSAGGDDENVNLKNFAASNGNHLLRPATSLNGFHRNCFALNVTNFFKVIIL